MKWQIKNLKNKSRKGEYIYIKEPKKQGRYYKLTPGTPLDAYIEYYIDTTNKRRKKKGTIQQYRQVFSGKKNQTKTKVSAALKRYATRYAKTTKSTRTLSSNIKKGVTSYTIPDALNITDGSIRQAYKETLKPLILNEKLLNIMTLEENISRLKKNFEFRAHLTDTEKQLILTQISIGKISLREFINIIQKVYRKGMKWKEISDKKRKLGRKDIQAREGTSKKNLNKIEIEIIYRN